jgi:hypothetical protein
VENERTVYVVQNDPRKDYSAATEFGRLKDIFGDVRGRYKTDAMLEHARRVLANWQPGDHILIGGDPTLCGIAIAVALEFDSVVRTLNWDKYDFQYISRRWDFGPEARGV